MNRNPSPMPRSRRALHLAAAVALGAAAQLGLAGAASAQPHPWTTVGSAGTVDDADTRIVSLVNAEATLRASAAAGSVLNMRYNVVSLEGFNGVGQYLMRVRFRDNGDGARVQLALRRANNNGTTSTLATFDSDTYAPAVSYQLQQRCIAVDWEFMTAANFIEATLTKATEHGQPGLVSIQLIPENCTP